MTVATLPTPRTLAAALICLAALVAGPAPSAPPAQDASLLPRVLPAPAQAATPGSCIAHVNLQAPPGAWIDVVLPPGWVAEPGLPDQASLRAFGVRLSAAPGAVDLPLRRLTPDAAPLHAEVHHQAPQGPITERWPIAGCGS